jgi:hypothetical protein
VKKDVKVSGAIGPSHAQPKAGLIVALVNLPLIGVISALSLTYINGPLRFVPPLAFAAWCLHVQLSAHAPLTARGRWQRSRRRREMLAGTLSTLLMLWLVAYPWLAGRF